ncbi:MAG: NAD(+)/NADH kinase [Candidatus Thermoplasmatota archaeon]|nr:NAD(+)/NADH kinase [Candidatus Thermoplasmatota archaeon]
MRFGIVCNPHKKKSLALSKDVYKFLSQHGDVFAEEQTAQFLGITSYTLLELNQKADIVVTIGGDGTIIKTAQAVEKPIFAINSGGMGFLCEMESKYAVEGLERIVDGKYTIEERAKLKVLFNGKRLPDAANEMTLQTARIAKIMYFQLFVEDELIDTLGADGVIIATPTGSTSYALSVGGPIMDPAVNAMVVAPLAPFRLSARPWIVPLQKKIRVTVLSKSKETKLVIDGDYALDVSPKDEIVVTGSERKICFVRFGESFYQMVRLKLVR